MRRPDTLPDQTTLLHRLAEGDEKAFTHIFDFYRDRIYTTAITFLKVPVAAEEIVQDTFLKVWMKRTEFRNVDNFEGYLFTIARNCTFDRLKKRSYQSQEDTLPPAHVSDADFLLRRHESETILQSAIDRLPNQQKKVFLLSTDQGMSQEEIADQLGITKETAKSHLMRALKSLRKKLRKLLAF